MANSRRQLHRPASRRLNCLTPEEPEFRALVTDINLGKGVRDGWAIAPAVRGKISLICQSSTVTRQF